MTSNTIPTMSLARAEPKKISGGKLYFILMGGNKCRGMRQIINMSFIFLEKFIFLRNLKPKLHTGEPII